MGSPARRLDAGDRDLAGFDEMEQWASIGQALETDLATPFDLGNREAPLFRFIVFIRSTDEFTLLFSCHHAIMDGWGHRVLLSQLLEAYTCSKSGSQVFLGKPDVSCKELSVSLHAVRNSRTAADFWKQYMTGTAPGPRVSTGLSEPMSTQNAVMRELSPGLYSALARVARTQAVSLQALLLSGWMNTLRRRGYARESVVTGVVTNGRSEYLSDPLSAVGLFWNLVPVVSRSSGPVIEQALRVHADLIAIHPHAGYPLTSIIPSEESRYLFASSFRYVNFWNTVAPAAGEGGVRVTGGSGYDMYPFPLNCSAARNPADGAGYLKIEYLEETIRADEAETAIEEYLRILEETAAIPGE